ncbi:MAG: methyltransferase domain-containing protein [Chitinophagales bacterium]|nr:methyltransferase domain-containing protein [Chitinophagales bacterium]
MSITYRIKALLGYDASELDTEVHKKNQMKIIHHYLQNNTERKLQVGAQGSPMKAWLNVDILPKTADTAYMDATKRFPFEENIFSYIFAEHMIEHITYDEGQFMLRECFRVMKPNGVIRLATPNLDKISEILKNPEKEEYRNYIQLYVERFYGKDYPIIPALQINKLFYGFHHRFIHNFESLSFILEQAGFKNIIQREVYQSEHSALQNLEKHAGMMGEENNQIETFVVEAMKM